MQKEIFEYIRKRRHGKVAKVGVIVAVEDDGRIKIGWSKCCIKAKKGAENMTDKFDFVHGLNLAKNRAKGVSDSPKAPDSIRRQIRQMGARAVRYFKDASSLVMPV